MQAPFPIQKKRKPYSGVFFILILVLLVGFSACRKCKECSSSQITTFVSGTTQTGDTIVANLGKTCGKDLKAVDGEVYENKAVIAGDSASVITRYTCQEL